MRLQDRYPLENIRNQAAERVYSRVEQLIEKQHDFCTCDTCVLDLGAFVLNRVNPRYTTSLLGDLHPDNEKIKKLDVEIDLALRSGLERLREHPHHE